MSNASFIPEEALQYLQSKKLTPGFDYRDVWKEEHDNAFTVAKMMQLDLLKDTHEAVAKALAEGQTFEQFRDSLKPTLVKKGWWGKQTIVDPQNDEEKEVQLGSDARLKTIYQTNMRTARAAGQWERIQRTKDALPYLLYQLGPSMEHRLEHESWNGLLLPIDDPFWAQHTPPNGWGCKCWIRQISRLEAKQLQAKGKVQTEAPETKTRTWVNKRTGEEEIIPEGIEPGWNYNPKARQKEILSQYTNKINRSEYEIAKASVSSAMKDGFESWYQSPIGDYPVAILSLLDREKIGSKVQTAVLSAQTLEKQNRVHGELSPEEYLLIQTVIDEGAQFQENDTNLIYFQEDNGGYVVIVKATRTGKGLFITSFRRLSTDEAKRNKEIERLKAKMKK